MCRCDLDSLTKIMAVVLVLVVVVDGPWVVLWGRCWALRYFHGWDDGAAEKIIRNAASDHAGGQQRGRPVLLAANNRQGTAVLLCIFELF